MLAVLAGQSFYGRESADELVKTVLLYVISGFISWLSWKGNKDKTALSSGGSRGGDQGPDPTPP